MSDVDCVRIFIRDCHVALRIGIYESEMREAQPVLINIECESKPHRRYDDITEKNIAQVISYEPLYNFITQDLPRLGHIYLLESAAEKIAQFCLSDPRVMKARVRIEKIAIFPEAAGAGIELYRERL